MEKQDVKQTARRGRRDDAGTSGALMMIGNVRSRGRRAASAGKATPALAAH